MLNESLAIPIDQKGRLEVDVLCADARIAVELDGGQHLGDLEAYRRDRLANDVWSRDRVRL